MSARMTLVGCAGGAGAGVGGGAAGAGFGGGGTADLGFGGGTTGTGFGGGGAADRGFGGGGATGCATTGAGRGSGFNDFAADRVSRKTRARAIVREKSSGKLYDSLGIRDMFRGFGVVFGKV
jgi:hypothetical protein